MKKDKLLMQPDQSSKETQVLYIDGCKESVKYSDQKNPAAVQNIKDTLISSGSIKGRDFLHFLSEYAIIIYRWHLENSIFPVAIYTKSLMKGSSIYGRANDPNYREESSLFISSVHCGTGRER